VSADSNDIRFFGKPVAGLSREELVRVVEILAKTRQAEEALYASMAARRGVAR
jgi:hypothetical protein